MRSRDLILVGFVAALLGGAAILSAVRQPSLAISQYQGIHPSFASVFYGNRYYTAEQKYEASTCRIHSASMNFDPDEFYRYKPNLLGSLRDIQIVRNIEFYEPEDTYGHILRMGGSPQPDGPYKTYTWEIDVGEGTVERYEMQLWLCSLELNLWVKADQTLGGSEAQNQRYRDTEVWLRMEVGPSWYIAGTDEVFFGLAYMELAEYTTLSPDDSNLDVMPKAKWEALSLYDRLGGDHFSNVEPDVGARLHKGKRLNQGVFRREWYVPVTLTNFGTYGMNWIDSSYKADSVQLKMLVHVFVVGKWVVKPEDERDMEEHEPPMRMPWLKPLMDALANLGSVLGTPGGILGLLLIAGFIVVLAIILTGGLPWIMLYLTKGGGGKN